MFTTALKTITWSTLIAAVLSAVMLGFPGIDTPHSTGHSDDAVRAGAKSPARPGLAGAHKTAASEADAAAEIARPSTSR